MNVRCVACSMAFLAILGHPGAASAQDKDFVALFNGKDLAGWKTHPNAPGNWRVENGILIGSGPKFSYLFTESGDFKNVHVRVEARVSEPGNSGVHIRAPFKGQISGLGYEAQIDNFGAWKTGTLFIKDGAPSIIVKDNLVKPKEWLVLDHIVYDNQIIIRVNGKSVIKHTDADRAHARGHIALQMHNPKTTVEFKSVLVKELKSPPSEIELPKPVGPLADKITTQTLDLSDGIKYAYRGGRPNRSNLALAPWKDGYRLGWTDLKGHTHVSALSADFKLAGKDVVIPDLDLRGLVAHDDGALGLMAAELPLRMCVLRLSPAGKEEFRTVLTGAKGEVLKEKFLEKFWSFTGRLVASPTEYAAHFSHGWRTEPTVVHTGGYFGRVDFKGKVVKENTWTVSHSLDQRTLYHKDTFLTLSLGDAFPIGVYFENRATGKNVLSYPPPETKGMFDPRGAMHLGSMVPVGDNVAAAFMLAHGENKVLTYQVISPDAKVLSSTKLREASKNAPHVVRLAPYGANLLLAWQEDKNTSKLVVIDRQGKVLNQPTMVHEPLPDNDDLVVLANGDVGWVLGTHGDRTVRFVRVGK